MRSLLRQILISVTPPILFNALRLIYNKGNKYYALDKMEKKLIKYLDFNCGYFIEIGANNGITQSNTYYFEKVKKWRGVLIEPSQNNYLLCKKNRSKANKYYCNACVSFNFKEEFVKIAYSDLVSTPINLESDESNPFSRAKQGLTSFMEDEIPIYGAIPKTMNEILIDSSSTRDIDFFSLDVEGAEIEVLKGIDYNKYKFRYILVESSTPNKIEDFLAKHNYRLIEKLSYHDYLFEFV